MNLSKIEIVNYKSIKNISILTDPTCQGFVGINESGKSNILNALSLLDKKRKLNTQDIRVEGQDEGEPQESFVEYYFKLNKNEINDLVEKVFATIYTENSLPKFLLGKKSLSLKQFLLTRDQGVYLCNIMDGTRTSLYYALPQSYISPIKSLLKVKGNTQVITAKSGAEIKLSNYSYINAKCIDEKDISLFEECTTNDLNTDIGVHIRDYITAHLPNVVFWKYNENNLLPNNIDIAKFGANPNICMPLKSMFHLAGYEDITACLSKISTMKRSRVDSMFAKISKLSTDYLHKVWKSYKSVKFDLRTDGDNIAIRIKDTENYYDCDQRSDGFKRFITFLLVLSARVNTDEITESIIIVDEPDIGIHIKGQENLLQDLIKISNKNLVFYSTHSIFMIDKKNSNRHFIVEKKKEITHIKQVKESNITDDEVIYNALGYSIFEVLRQKNIIFEGWSDKIVFEKVANSVKGKAIFNNKVIGKVHSTGLRTILGVVKSLEIANREYIVISDSDEIAKSTKAKFINKENCEGKWYMYEDFVENIFTLEDFIKHKVLFEAVKFVSESSVELQSKVFDNTLFEQKDYKREQFIKNWLKSIISDSQKVKEVLFNIKQHIYTNLKASDVEDTYFELLNKLKDSSVV